jgi:hypothetical protein
MKRKVGATRKGVHMIKTASILVMPALMATLALAVDGPSVERGRDLFNGTKLGTNGKSCAGCHRNPKQLERAATYDDSKLGEIINQCIENPLKGKALDPSSVDMKSITIYLKSFANAR